MNYASKYPELIVGLAGPIGVDVDEITSSVQSALSSVGYKSDIIKLTKAMLGYPVEIQRVDEEDFFQLMNFKMDYANKLCEDSKDLSFLSRLAVQAIRTIRSEKSGKNDMPLPSHAYIIRQFKRPEEIRLMRSVYGKQFILVSAYGSVEDRKKVLEDRLRHSASTLIEESVHANNAVKLIERDESEAHKYGGQQLRDTFHLADVFVDGISKQAMDVKLSRFMRAFFGLNTAAPTKDEYGMYTAKSASLRSCDLSRQIGAAIFTSDGEIIAQGCNEVPKAFGGTYWDLEEPDHRDVKIGYDPNDDMKREVLRNTIERLWSAKLLSESAKAAGSAKKLVDQLICKASKPGEEDGALVGSAITDLTEFGRVVHAEMCAICDAARLGRSVRGATLYCTTFPCHNCTKHILASGIARVVYMEPYPKSKAKELHKNEIEIEKHVEGKVSFVPFIGISPSRYRDIFLKERKRKSMNGKARNWYDDEDVAAPMMASSFSSYPELERAALGSLFGEFEAKPGG